MSNPALPSSDGPPTDRHGAPLALDDMLRIMDVATTLRRERERATAELNVEETRAFLRKKLMATAAATGETVSEAEVDAAIEQYYRSLHAYEPPPRGWKHFCCHAWVRRVPIIIVLATVLVLTALTWWLFFSASGPWSATGRDARAMHAAIAEADSATSALDKLPLDDAASAARASIATELRSARDAGDATGVVLAAARLDALRERVEEAYEMHVVNPSVDSPGDSAVEVLRRDTGVVNGYYLIVEARDSRGNAVRRTVTDALTNKPKRVNRWAELVPEAVFERLGEDKRDGILDETLVARKRRGALAPDVVMKGPDGKPLTLTRQLTRWEWNR